MKSGSFFHVLFECIDHGLDLSKMNKSFLVVILYHFENIKQIGLKGRQIYDFFVRQVLNEAKNQQFFKLHTNLLQFLMGKVTYHQSNREKRA